jgi:predicted DNA-binding protein
MIVSKKTPKATKRSGRRTFSLIAHTAKTVARILRRQIERKIEDVLVKDQFEFKRGK